MWVLIFNFSFCIKLLVSVFVMAAYFSKALENPKYPIYPTPPLEQDMTQGQFLSGV